ncbi:BCCT family transporter [Virgibacillus alimentarius]|uniref:Choline/carnitine/betaine transport n=1 Tax=Virgibacillus alimentarius TaxID=698769 RepID=A0ABS4SBS7_9BACI|nr:MULTISPECIES: BCCT family transporter [Virgibacillus]MBP2258470.1 choline/carnitine/betaine transport [Virgibacillus alimentarius]HLR67078.1 BCCT family transporter [Virgibacillus sp.]
MKNLSKKGESIDKSVLFLSGGALIAFVIFAWTNQELVTNIVNYLFDLSVKYFGSVYQILMLGTFLIALFLGFSKFGKIRLGKLDKPEISTFKWISIIMCTLLAAGGVFWAAAEPLSHFLTVPPHFSGIEPGSTEAVTPALAASFVDWGFLSWAILGTLGTFVLMYAHYHRGAPLKPRALLYPIFGEKIMKKSVLGTVVDAFSVVSVAAGTIGPIGFLGLQAGYGLSALFGIPDNVYIQSLIIIVIVFVAGVSAVTGIHKGIQILSSYNVILALFLMVVVLLLGPGLFIFDSYLESFGLYVQNFFSMNTFRSDGAWLGGWTVFFFAWFIGYGPMMAMFVSRISRGRTIREIVTAVAVIAPIVTAFWFTVVGGTGIFQEIKNPGSISEALSSDGPPAAMIAIADQLPFGTILGFLFLLATVIFVLTTTDSMSLTISMAITGNGDPSKLLRVFWAFLMGVVATVLLTIGEDSVNSLQSFIVVTAVPVSLLMLTTFWTAPHVCKELEKEQLESTTKRKYIQEE